MSGEFIHEGHRIAYDERGEGPHALVLVHGLLLNRRMFDPVVEDLAGRGHHVITVDLLGHGRSDRPEDLRLYSMPLFAAQVEALLKHLGIERAIVGGASLGANVALELAVHRPDLVEALVIEMPVLDNALAGVAAFFSPILLGLRLGRPLFEGFSAVASLLPRTHLMADIVLDTVRQRPGPSIAILEGLLLGETAPNRSERQTIEQPVLIIGHPGDPVHPFSDSGMLAEEVPDARLVRARSILEWRLKPDRLNGELAGFLDQVWGG